MFLSFFLSSILNFTSTLSQLQTAWTGFILEGSSAALVGNGQLAFYINPSPPAPPDLVFWVGLVNSTQIAITADEKSGMQAWRT